jgi:glycosyltransferase involved in cell wall biosynthesis
MSMLSIITPVLNGEAYIEENILSVRRLSIPHEHIIVDGGSTDSTLEIIAKYPKLTLLNQKERSGMYGAIHQGILESKGDYISYLNADDRYTCEFDILYNEIVTSNATLAYSHTILHYEKDGSFKKAHAAVGGKFFLRMGIMPFCQSSSIFSKEAYWECKGLRHEVFRVCGDLDLFQRIAYSKNAKIIFVPVYGSIFLKTGVSLGDRSRDLYVKECPQLKRNDGQQIYVRMALRLLRLCGRFSHLYGPCLLFVSASQHINV